VTPPGIVTSTVFVAAFAALSVFGLAYWILAPWWRSPAGRALMVMSTGFWLVTLAQLLRHPLGLSTAGSAAFAWFQIAADSVAVIGICWITGVLVRVQWQGRRGRRKYFEDTQRRGRDGSR
jgi:hypothetical protein